MHTQVNEAGEQLKDAFQLFNQFSERLANSYADLEAHVARLTKELAQEREARLNQLAEKELLAKRLESLLDALPGGIVVLDAAGDIMQTNPTARDMLMLQSGDARQNWQRLSARAFVTSDDEPRLKDGRWVSICARPLAEQAGKIILITDVTENHELQSMLNRQQRLSSLGEMIASLAHQIRTPLSSALLYVCGINHPANDAIERGQFADKAKERLSHLERMVNEMLSFAKGDVSDSEHIEILAIMSSLAGILESQINGQIIGQIDGQTNDQTNRQPLSITVDSKLEGITIRANADALLSALQNIVDNAVQACSDNASRDGAASGKATSGKATSGESVMIEIDACLSPDNRVEISISDNGCGMSAAIRDRLLEPFFTTRANGTGLGLAVVNATIERYHGELRIESRDGAGSRFTISFPPSTADDLLPSSLGSAQTVGLMIDTENVPEVQVRKSIKHNTEHNIEVTEGEI